MLTTLESHRRRGLARAALVALLLELSGEGGGRDLRRRPLFCYVASGNSASLGLLRSLGFEEGGELSWQGWTRRGGGGGGPEKPGGEQQGGAAAPLPAPS
jgi:L-amino acid N-acyltransferase YncA